MTTTSVCSAICFNARAKSLQIESRFRSMYSFGRMILSEKSGRPQYRLRVGEVRVFYDVSGTTVEVLAIVAKSEAESWLAQFASPE